VIVFAIAGRGHASKVADNNMRFSMVVSFLFHFPSTPMCILVPAGISLWLIDQGLDQLETAPMFPVALYFLDGRSIFWKDAAFFGWPQHFLDDTLAGSSR
jgi:hypothetical protein